MSAELTSGGSLLPAPDVDGPIDAVRARDTGSKGVGERLPRVTTTGVATTGVATDTVDDLLLSVARGDHEAFVALQVRMAGLVRLNVRRVLRDASRTEAVIHATFAEVLEEAFDFDPSRDSAQTWLLLRAHQRATEGRGSTDDPDGPQDPGGPSAAVSLP